MAVKQNRGVPQVPTGLAQAHKDRAATTMAEFLYLHEKELRAFPDRLQDIVCNEEKVSLGH